MENVTKWLQKSDKFDKFTWRQFLDMFDDLKYTGGRSTNLGFNKIHSTRSKTFQRFFDFAHCV